MALYSVDLMQRLLTAAFNGGRSATYSSEEGLYYYAPVMGHGSNQAAIDSMADPKANVSSTDSLAVRVSHRAYDTFDMAALPTQVDPLSTQFEVRDARLYLRFNSWFRQDELRLFWESYNQSALYYTMRYSSQYRYALIKVQLAVRKSSDPDEPEYWRGSSQPDLRLTYDPEQEPLNRVTGDILIDITDYVCDCPRYRDSIEDWKARFPVLLPDAHNVAPEATLSTSVEAISGNVTLLNTVTSERAKTYSGYSWKTTMTSRGVDVVFTFPSSRVIKQVRIYGWGSDTQRPELYSPHGWYVEGYDTVTSSWVKIPVVEYVRNAEVRNTDEVVTPQKSDYEPTVVNLDTSSGYMRYRLMFDDTHSPLSSEFHLKSIELYETDSLA